MSAEDIAVTRKIRNLLDSQRLAVMATVKNGRPYMSLMAFIFSENLEELVVATGISTQKYENLIRDARVTLLVDNRSGSAADFSVAMALSIVGNARLIEQNRVADYKMLYLDRHPSLHDFVEAESTRFFSIYASNYTLVSEFENVIEYRV